ncbi:CLAVATA3/ESR (CLE)-RELATED PROTEIN 22 [Salix viminalis]|uniref:CLAVATA3/ESR (CLE)-RELATED PROTEIN 22 n=1 Tax=Salix viminalis TaxID=40686 RepID=A0A9Q0SDP9_SALVM|nr:CLAVATA3/ESR (CLE)-RELATED PROTEIN 22 [Salix viminalis]
MELKAINKVRFCSKIFFEVEISAGAMRLLAVLVMALCLVIFGCIGSDAVPKAAFLSPVNGSNKKKSSPNLSSSSSSLEAVSTVFSNSGAKNKSITLDEMRVVPTGPNPLHNR